MLQHRSLVQALHYIRVFIEQAVRYLKKSVGLSINSMDNSGDFYFILLCEVPISKPMHILQTETHWLHSQNCWYSNIFHCNPAP